MANSLKPPAKGWEIIENYNISQLEVPEYQRLEQNETITKIAANFDPCLAGVITVARNPREKDKILDGQQRCAAAKMAGVKTLPAFVVYGKDEPDQSEHFYRMNNDRVALSAGVKFNARVLGKDAAALRINKALHQRGLHLLSSMFEGVPMAGWTTVNATAALDDLDAWGVLEPTLDILLEGIADRSIGLQRHFLLGVGGILKHDFVDDKKFAVPVDTKRLVETLKKTAPLAIMQAAQGMKGAMGGSLWPYVSTVILHEYNSGLQAKNRLEHYTPPKQLRRRKFQSFDRGQKKAS